MGTTKKSKEFDFTDSGNWDLTGTQISSDLLTLLSSVTNLYWNTHNWSTLPSEDGNGDRYLSSNTIYKVIDDVAEYSLGNHVIEFWGKFLNAGGSHLQLWSHYSNADVGGEQYCNTHLYRPGNYGFTIYMYMNDGVARLSCAYPSALIYNLNADTWYRFVLTLVGSSISIDVFTESGDLILRGFCDDMDLDDTDLGTFAFYLSVITDCWTIGGGPTGSKDQPNLYQPKSGSAVLSTDGKWRLPLDFVSLDCLQWTYDDTDDTDLEAMGMVTVSIRVYDRSTATWGSWIEVDINGDLSSISASPLDTIDLKIELSNDCGETKYKPLPSVKDLKIIYNAWWPDSGDGRMYQACEALDTLLEADSTLSAITGWEGCKIAQKKFYYPPMFDNFGIYICPVRTEMVEVAQHGSGINAFDRKHTIAIMPTVIAEGEEVELVLTRDDVGLLQFSEAVMDALIGMNLGSSFKINDVSDIEYELNEVEGPWENQSMITITVISKAEGR